MNIQPGEFWVADIRYTDGSASKKRPILILWVDGQDIMVAVVTFASPRSSTDEALADWKASGLRAGSTVRLSRLDCLEQSLLLHRLGMVSQTDAAKINSTWDQHIKPQF